MSENIEKLEVIMEHCVNGMKTGLELNSIASTAPFPKRGTRHLQRAQK
jgi:hypothetical protein